MYLKQIFFAVVRAGRKITNIYLQYTFEQERFKKDFILMNQKSRQNAKNSVEKDFYKLMNNSNFGYDCRNNLDNCKFVPIFDKLKEITYIKKYYNFFDPKVSKFFMSDLIAQEIEEKHNDDIIRISTEDKFYKLKKSAANTEKAQVLESFKEFDKKNIRQKKKRTLYHYLNRQEEAYKDKVKSLIDFDEDVCSIKSLAVKKESKINLTTRFMNGKMLMFCKTSIQSFVYDLIDVFMYPDDEISKIYDKYKIQKCFLYQSLTDTDSTSIFFVFICKIT